MASEVPCIATDVGNCRELLHNTGWILKNPKTKTIEEGIYNALETDNELIKEKGRNARKIIINNFSIQSIVKEYESLYSEIYYRNK